MTEYGKVVPTNVVVFVSSTFEDMAAERKVLVGDVFPGLQALCRPHHVNLVNIDLNWGLPRDAATHRGMLEIVRSELNRASIMVAVLGERFGGVPPGEYDSRCALEIYSALASRTTTLLAFRRKVAFTKQLALQSGRDTYFEADRERALEQEKLLKRLEHLGVEMTSYGSMEEFALRVGDRLQSALQETYWRKERVHQLQPCGSGEGQSTARSA